MMQDALQLEERTDSCTAKWNGVEGLARVNRFNTRLGPIVVIDVHMFSNYTYLESLSRSFPALWLLYISFHLGPSVPQKRQLGTVFHTKLRPLEVHTILCYA